MPERMLKVTEVAERLALGRAHTYSLIQRGVLPGVRIGRAVRVPESKLADYINTFAIVPEPLATDRR